MLLGFMIGLNPPGFASWCWNNVIARFLHPSVRLKIGFRRGKDITAALRERFDDESVGWLLEEMRLNQLNPLPSAQTHANFWKDPAGSQVHDPRGTPAYVKFLSTLENGWDGRHPLKVRSAIRLSSPQPRGRVRS